MSTEKKIQDFLHYYIGAECVMTKPSYHAVHELHLSSDRPFILTGKLQHYFSDATTKAEIKPLLSKLEDITEEEKKEIMKINDQEGSVNALGFNINKNVDFYFKRTNFQLVHYLLKKGYDLFGLVEAGLAVDKKTLKQ